MLFITEYTTKQFIQFIYPNMDLTTSKLFASTFTSFYSASDKPEVQRCLTAIKNNRVQMLQAFATPELLAQNPKGRPLLLYAAYLNSAVSALYLLRRGASLFECDTEGRTVFHMCAYTGHGEVLKTVRNEMKLKRIIQLNKKYIELLNKSSYKRTDVKAGKLKFSVSENRQSTFDKIQQTITSLYEEYVFGTMTQTYKLFTAEVKESKKNCFHLGCLNRYQRCSGTLEYMFQELANYNMDIDQDAVQMYMQVNKCLEEGQKVDPRLYEDTLELIEETIVPHRLAEIKKQVHKRLLSEVESIMEAKDKDEHTPLYIASKNGSTAIINLLKKWENNKSKESSQKQNLIKVASNNLARSHIMDLCQASKVSDPKTMNFLITCGEEINKKKTIFGTFALLQAVKAFQKDRNIEPIRMLIQSGADVNEQDTNGWTVLHHACEKGLKPILQYIFKIWKEGKVQKILINRLTNKNYHMLHLAAMNNRVQIIEYLLTNAQANKLQINSSITDGDGCTMLHHAARKGALEALKKILELKSSLIYEQDMGSNTALHYAAMNDHVPCIKYLLFFDSDFDKLQEIKNLKGKFAKDLTINKKPFENVFTAARKGDVNQVRKMVSEDMSLKKIITPIKERTLLILAVLSHHLLIVKFLTQIGVDQSHKDKSGKTARDYALQLEKKAKTKQESVVCKNILDLLKS